MSQTLHRNAPSEISSASLSLIPLRELNAHPKNPRLVPCEDVIETIRSALAVSDFDPAHALIVRPFDIGYQIIAGHHRFEAAKRAGLEVVPCWVRELDDAAAYMLLVTSNTQSELSALERGLHALNSGQDVKAYAATIGRKRGIVQDEVQAARVAATVRNITHDLSACYQKLVEIHAAPDWLWPALVETMLAKNWTVEQTRGQVARLKQQLPDDLPSWISDAVVTGMVAGTIRPGDIGRMIKSVDDMIAEIGADMPNGCAGTLDVGSFATLLGLDEATSLSQVMAICERELQQIRQDRLAVQRGKEEAEERARRYLEYVSLDEWNALDEATKATLLPPPSDLVSVGRFNKQEGNAIEWAMWSWNPITGCLHDCPYCYAREIATSERVAAVYPNGFAPTLRPRSLLVPRYMKVPGDATFDSRHRNVFTGSMADIFGRWVPLEWIEAVLAEIRAAPDWNFLCLTKFPKRMAEFDIPPNAWMGTTVDLQARVTAAEAGFANISAKVKWLSCEPLLEPLRFKHLDRFNWIVIGGASRTAATPTWHPPFEWIVDLVYQARDAGLRVYFKTNLFGRDGPDGYQGNSRILELPFDAPIAPDPIEAPAIFHYLGGSKAE